MPHTEVRGPPAPVPVRADAAHAGAARAGAAQADAAHAGAAHAGAAHAGAARAGAARAGAARVGAAQAVPRIKPRRSSSCRSRPCPWAALRPVPRPPAARALDSRPGWQGSRGRGRLHSAAGAPIV
jgi:hypothetical protein